MFLALEKVMSGCEQSQIAHSVYVQQMSITKPNFFVPSVYLASVSERPMSTRWHYCLPCHTRIHEVIETVLAS